MFKNNHCVDNPPERLIEAIKTKIYKKSKSDRTR